jgi:hypothetical protein
MEKFIVVKIYNLDINYDLAPYHQTIPLLFETEHFAVNRVLMGDNKLYNQTVTNRFKKDSYTITYKGTGIAVQSFKCSKGTAIRICKSLQKNFQYKPKVDYSLVENWDWKFADLVNYWQKMYPFNFYC